MSVSKLLIANRGEIACRVIRSARAKGIPTVAVYSEPDAGAPHVAMADQAVALGGTVAAESYLVVDKLLEAAARTGADAIHPGYGFLAENAGFAQACADAGITFVGPPPSAIEAMGDKSLAKARMIAADVPTVPGFQGTSPADQAPERLIAAAADIGYPLLVKASAGGGGKGMRRVDSADQLAEALDRARSEAQRAFGNGDLLLEKLVEGARHVEIQVFADGHGNVLHLGERDCSAQRRHQKVIEEAPCPVVDEALRAKMGAAAVAAAKAIGYVGAGTVEFLLDGDGRSFYFLEMNTRLQVEHPVTELITGLDLVSLQLDVAAGEPLPFTQDDVTLSGHAIEARLYAEDAAAGFLPATGTLLAWRPAEGAGVRVDHGLTQGRKVTADYDPMLAKVIAYGRDREEARRRLVMALAETSVLGVTTNKRFLGALISHPAFVAGEVTTSFIESSLDAAFLAGPELDARFWAVAGALWMDRHATIVPTLGPAWRSAHDASSHVTLRAGEEEQPLALVPSGEGQRVGVGEASLVVRLLGFDGERVRVDVDGLQETARFAWDPVGPVLYLEVGERAARLEAVVPGAAEEDAAGDGKVAAPMSGRVLGVHVTVGDAVEASTKVVTLEAMKLETALTAGVAGVVSEIRAEPGAQVQGGQVLVIIEPSEEDSE